MKNTLILITLALAPVFVAVASDMQTPNAVREENHILDAETRAAVKQALIKRFDTDGDGTVSTEERTAARAVIIARFDRDGDGTLRSERRALIKRLDRNGDGKVDASEREVARNARH